MSNVETILGRKIYGKSGKPTDAQLTNMLLRFEMLWQAFQLIKIPGNEVVFEGNVITNNNEVVYLT